MQKVKFLQDFQGRETGENFYKQGQEVELPDNVVSVLLADGRVELVKQAAKFVSGATISVGGDWKDGGSGSSTPWRDEPEAEEEAPQPKKRGRK